MEVKEKLLEEEQNVDKQPNPEEIHPSDHQQKIMDKLDSSDIMEEGPVKEKNHSSQKEKLKKQIYIGLKFAGILLTTILIPVILSAYEDTTDKWIQNLFGEKQTKQVTASPKHDNTSPKKDTLQSDEAVLIKLNQLANNGKTINCLIPLGTDKSILLQNWGEPDSKSKLGLIEYWVYKKHDTTIGISNNKMIDIRSDDPSLKKLTLFQLQETGKPDQEYDHMHLDQHFLVYYMGEYKLRLVFPKPTDQTPNPKLINISLVDINYSN